MEKIKSINSLRQELQYKAATLQVKEIMQGINDKHPNAEATNVKLEDNEIVFDLKLTPAVKNVNCEFIVDDYDARKKFYLSFFN